MQQKGWKSELEWYSRYTHDHKVLEPIVYHNLDVARETDTHLRKYCKTFNCKSVHDFKIKYCQCFRTKFLYMEKPTKPWEMMIQGFGQCHAEKTVNSHNQLPCCNLSYFTAYLYLPKRRCPFNLDTRASYPAPRKMFLGMVINTDTTPRLLLFFNNILRETQAPISYPANENHWMFYKRKEWKKQGRFVEEFIDLRNYWQPNTSAVLPVHISLENKTIVFINAIHQKLKTLSVHFFFLHNMTLTQIKTGSFHLNIKLKLNN